MCCYLQVGYVHLRFSYIRVFYRYLIAQQNYHVSSSCICFGSLKLCVMYMKIRLLNIMDYETSIFLYDSEGTNQSKSCIFLWLYAWFYLIACFDFIQLCSFKSLIIDASVNSQQTLNFNSTSRSRNKWNVKPFN